MPKISEERKQATRQRLIDAAVEVALAGGPEGITTRRILEAAGLSAGALYHYFSSKDELYEAIAERFVGIDGVADLDAVDVVDAQVAVIADCFGPRTTSVLGRLRAMALDNPAVAAVLARYDRRIVEQFDALNRRTVAEGLYRSDLDTEALVEVFAVFLDGFSLRPPDGFVTGRQRTAAAFVDLVAARAVDPSHPRATDLIERARAAIDGAPPRPSRPPRRREGSGAGEAPVPRSTRTRDQADPGSARAARRPRRDRPDPPPPSRGAPPSRGRTERAR